MSTPDNNWIKKMRYSEDHREFVGPTHEYDLNAAIQFNLLTFLGLREYHTLLDIGCGSLRGGRLFIVYLLQGGYFGVEPEQWLVENALAKEVGKDLVEIKSPSFLYNRDFLFDGFNQKFDFIIAQSVFSHAPGWQIRKCMAGAAKFMKSKSIFAATYFDGFENHKGTEWVYPETTKYTPKRMSEMASDAGLSNVPITWPHPRGQKWILLFNPEDKNHVLELAREASISNINARGHEIEKRLAQSEGELYRLRTHPYVRAGVKLKRFLRWLSRS